MLSLIKIILIVLLVLVLIILLLILCVLFVPVRYRADTHYHEGVVISAKVHWLLRSFLFKFDYSENGSKLKIRFLFIDIQKLMSIISRHKEKKNSKKQSRKRNQGRSKAAQQKAGVNRNIEEKQAEKENDSQKRDNYNKEEKQSEKQLEVCDQENENQGKCETTDVENREKATHKLIGFLENIVKKLKNVFEKIRKVVEKLKDLKRNILQFLKRIGKKRDWLKQLREFLHEDNTSELICILKANVIHLIKKIKPSKVRGKVRFGFDDIALTGEVAGALAIFFAWYGKSVECVPVFDQACLEGDIFFKGKIRVITLVIVGYKVLCSKQYKEARKKYDSIKEE